MAAPGPVGILGPVPAGRGIGLWAPTRLVLDSPDLSKQLIPFDWGVPYGPPPLLQTWIFSTNIPLLTTVPPDTTHFPLAFDWGTPEGPPPLLQTWTFTNRLLLSIVQAPFNQDDWPLPTPPARLQQSWTYGYNLNLIGQDRFTPGIEVFDLPPRPYEFSNLFRTWTYAYNRNLVGKDQLPIGENVFDLSPRPYAEPATRTWAYVISQALTAAPPPPLVTMMGQALL